MAASSSIGTPSRSVIVSTRRPLWLGGRVGHAHLAGVDRLEHGVEPAGGVGFVAQVELLSELVAHPGDEPLERAGDADRDLPGEEAAHGFEHGQVGGDALFDAGTEDLDRDGRAVGQRGPVHDGE
jgi:hypothetical protein